MSRKLIIGLFGIVTAFGASAAIQGNPAQPFEQQGLQMRDYAGLDRHECRMMKQRQLNLPAYCIAR